jgi:hypothetical protein
MVTRKIDWIGSDSVFGWDRRGFFIRRSSWLFSSRQEAPTRACTSRPARAWRLCISRSFNLAGAGCWPWSWGHPPHCRSNSLLTYFDQLGLIPNALG